MGDGEGEIKERWRFEQIHTDIQIHTHTDIHASTYQKNIDPLRNGGQASATILLPDTPSVAMPILADID